VLALLSAVVSLAGCGAPLQPTARWQVELGGEPWQVLLASRDGMRGLSDFDGADGMLFDVDQDVDPGSVVFVMDGVPIPLDIAWFRDDGGLVGTASMVPCPARPCPNYEAPGRFRWAIEASVGAFNDLAPDARLDVHPD
jgi:uncharacterized membrane protein (UPF0127 family)